MRRNAGLSLDDAAPRLDLTRSGLHRLETGVTAAHVHIARSMMDLYDQYVPDLLDTIRVSRRRGWWQAYRVPNRDYLGWEAGAAAICEVAVVRLPDLLQTENYTRGLLTGREQVAEELKTRRIRQDRLTGSGGSLTFTAVLDESTLRNRVSDPSVMRAQLAHLVKLAARPNVRIRVLPAAAGAGVRAGGFRLLEFDHPDDSPVLYADCAHVTVREDEPDEVTESRRLFAVIESAALPEEDSVEFVQQLAGELYPAEQITWERRSA